MTFKEEQTGDQAMVTTDEEEYYDTVKQYICMLIDCSNFKYKRKKARIRYTC